MRRISLIAPCSRAGAGALKTCAIRTNVPALSTGFARCSIAPPALHLRAISCGATLHGAGFANKQYASRIPRALASRPAGRGLATAAGDITEAELLECQAGWANGIESISAVYLAKGDFVAAAGKVAGELYGYGHHAVLFKPTKATKHPFRPTGAEAMSYFVGAEAMGADEFKGEDAGFAINGGKGWSKVVFNNHLIDLNGTTATAMGTYDFTCATSGEVATVEYTFAYKRCADGKPRICLHHSSVPYKP